MEGWNGGRNLTPVGSSTRWVGFPGCFTGLGSWKRDDMGGMSE